MNLALRYTLLGILCASITAAFQPAWYITIIALWVGLMLGIAITCAVFWVDDVVQYFERKYEK
jgi:hypothetical protein